MATELDEMVVRLTGEAEEYKRMLDQSIKHTEQAAAGIQHAANKIEGFQSSVESFGKTALHSLEALGAVELFHKAFEASEKREEGLIRLSASLKANGRNVRETLKDYTEFAKAQKELTNASVGDTLAMLKKAEAFGITGDQAKKAAKEAYALAAATGVEAESAIRVTAAIAKGDVEQAKRMSRMILELRGIEDMAEYQKRYTSLVKTGFETQGELADTLGFRLERLKKTFKSMIADVGDAIQHAAGPLVSMLESIRTEWDNLSKEAKGNIVTFGTWVVSTAAVLGALFLIKTAAMATGGALKGMAAALIFTIPGQVVVALGAVYTAYKGFQRIFESSEDAINRFKNKPSRVAAQKQVIDEYEEKIHGGLTPQQITEQHLLARKLADAGKLETDRSGKEFGMDAWSATLEKIRKEMVGNAAPAVTMAKTFREINKEMDIAAATYGKTSQEAKAYAEVLYPLEEELKKANEELDKLYAVDPKTGGRFNEATKEAEEKWTKASDAVRDANAELDKIAIKAKAAADVVASSKIVEAFAGELQALGMDADQLKYRELVMKGATLTQKLFALGVTEAKNHIKEMTEAFEQHNKLMEEGKSLTESLQSPIEKYNTELFRLGNLVLNNAINWDTYTRAVGRANQELMNQQQLKGEQYGTAEAFESMRQYRAGNTSNPDRDPAKLLIDVKNAIDGVKASTELVTETMYVIFNTGN